MASKKTEKEKAAPTNPTLQVKCDCGVSETTKDYIEIPEKCEKCGKQTHISLADNERPWEAKKETK